MKYHYCEPSLLTVPTKQVKMPDTALSIDMSNVAAFDAAEDSVYLRTHDKWLNLSQGYSDGQDLNHYAATAVGDGVYEFPVTLSGPVTWNIYYKFKV